MTKQMEKAYAKTGDEGKTSLGDGSRVLKFDERIKAIGAVGEANAAIGVARAHAEKDITEELIHIQNDLFDLDADLCFPEEREEGGLRLTERQIKWIEERIDIMAQDLHPAKTSVLPGGTPASAFLHQARAFVRRAERRVVSLSMHAHLNPHAQVYLNRLGDYLLVAARWANGQGKTDRYWEPGRYQ